MLNNTILYHLAQIYPQLYLPPKKGRSAEEIYIDYTRRGKPSDGSPLGSHFRGSAEDRDEQLITPAGAVRSVFLKKRSDFETFYQIMACRGEPVPVAVTMNAAFISNINNWRRIEEHKKEWMAQGGIFWQAEFEKYTANPDNFRDNLLLLGHGSYSGIQSVSCERSLTIRTYHEAAHFICGKKHPEKKHAIWDEILADCIGLLFADGYYDAAMAKQFLGVSKQGYTGGRLENYTPPGTDLNNLAIRVSGVIDNVENTLNHSKTADGYKALEILQAQWKEYTQCLN